MGTSLIRLNHRHIAARRIRGRALCPSLAPARCGGPTPVATRAPINFYGFGQHRSDGSTRGDFHQLGGIVSPAPQGETFQTLFDFGRATVSIWVSGGGIARATPVSPRDMARLRLNIDGSVGGIGPARLHP